MGKKVPVNASITLTYKLAFNLPEECEGRSLIITWKRGSKSQNKGETKSTECLRGRAVFGDEVELICTLLQDAKKKSFESKFLELELKEETKKKPLAKASIDLKEFADSGNHDNVTVPLSFGKKKKKDGGSGPALKISCQTTWTHIGKKKLVKRDGTGQGSAVVMGDEEYDLQTASEISEEETTLADETDSEFSETESEDDEESEQGVKEDFPSRNKRSGKNKEDAAREERQRERDRKEKEKKILENADRDRRSTEKREKEKREKDKQEKEKKGRDKKREADKKSREKKEKEKKKDAGSKDSVDVVRKAEDSKLTKRKGRKENGDNGDTPSLVARGEEDYLGSSQGDGSARRSKRKTLNAHTTKASSSSKGADERSRRTAEERQRANKKSAKGDKEFAKSNRRRSARGTGTFASAVDLKPPREPLPGVSSQSSDHPVIGNPNLEDEGTCATEAACPSDSKGAYPALGERLPRVERPVGPAGRRRPTKRASKQEENDPPGRKVPLPVTRVSGKPERDGDDGDIPPLHTAAKLSTFKSKTPSGSSSAQHALPQDDMLASRQLNQQRLQQQNDDLQAQITRLKEEAADVAAERMFDDSRASRADSLERQLEAEKASSEDLRRRLDDEHARTTHLEKQARALHTTEETTQERMGELTAQLENSEASGRALLASVEEKALLLAEAESELSASLTELGSLRVECSSAQASVEEVRNALRMEQKEKKRVVALLDEQRALVEDLNSALRDETSERETVQVDKRALDAEVASLEEECETTCNQLKEALANRAESMNALSRLQDECTSLEGQLAAESRKVARLTSQLEESMSQAKESALKAGADGDTGAAQELELLELRLLSQHKDAALNEAADERNALAGSVEKLKEELKTALNSAEDIRESSMDEVRSLKDTLRSVQAEALRACDAREKSEHVLSEAKAAWHAIQEAHDAETKRLSKDLSRTKSRLKKAELAAAAAEAMAVKRKERSDVDSKREEELRRAATATTAVKDARISELELLLETAETKVRELNKARETTSGAGVVADDEFKSKIQQRRQQQDTDHLKSKVKALELSIERSSFIAEHVLCLRYGDWDNGISPSARAIVSMLSEWKVFDDDDSNQAEAVSTLVSSLKKGFAACPQESRSFIGWLSYLCCLHDLLENEFGTTEDEDRGDIPTNGIYIVREDDDVDDDLLAGFFHELELLIYGVYSALIGNLTDKLARVTVPGVFDKSEVDFIHPISDCYDAAIVLHLFPSVRIQLFGQVFSFINAHAVNTLLNNAALCTCGSGFTVKLKLSEIEEFLVDNDKQLLPLARHHLTHLREMATMLVVDKSICSDEEAIQSVFPTLSLFQIRRVLEQYTPDDFSPDTISLDVLQFLENLTDQLAPPASVMMDESDILPMGRDFMCG